MALRKLQRRAGRVDAGMFLVEGPQAVRESLALPSGPGRLVQLWTDDQHRHPELVAAARNTGVEVLDVPGPVIAALAETVTPQGLVGVAPLLDTDPGALLTAPPALLAVLDSVREPGNAGAVIRAADAAGAGGVLLCGEPVDPHNGKCVRASAGSVFHLPVGVAGDPLAVVRSLRAAGALVLALTGRGTTDLYDLVRARPTAQPIALLLGTEAHGLADEVVAACDLAVRLPLRGRAESLNLAMAAAVALYAVAFAAGEPSDRGPT